LQFEPGLRYFLVTPLKEFLVLQLAWFRIQTALLYCPAFGVLKPLELVS
jgi:hypothetical protein